MNTKLHGHINIPIFGENEVILRREDKPFTLKLSNKKVVCNEWKWGNAHVPPAEKDLFCRFEKVETEVGPKHNPYRIISFVGTYDPKVWDRFKQTCGFTPEIELMFWDFSEIHLKAWYKENHELEFSSFSIKLDEASSSLLEKLWLDLGEPQP